MRLVYYSLANFDHDSREQQWIQSIRSLRIYNPSIPVWLFLFNNASGELLREAERQNVCVKLLGDYREFLERAQPGGSVLALYPTFHKFLALENLPLQSLTQLLYLDCDTFFFDDVSLLFDLHQTNHLYAREEPTSLPAQSDYDRQHVDVSQLKQIARSENLCYVAPFNSGVCLLNHDIWHSLIGLRDEYLGLAWRLLCGRELSGRAYRLHDPRIRNAVLDMLTASDHAQALPYPSEKNDWIIEQIALWLALGRLPQISFGRLSAEQVLQGHEVEILPRRGCVLAHYFSIGERDFFSCVPAIA